MTAAVIDLAIDVVTAWLFVATAGHAEVQEGNRVDEVQEKESSR
jgi:hypothetical protein